jgi:hypothetical protein
MERIEGRDEIGPWVIGGEDRPDAKWGADPSPPPPPRQLRWAELIPLGCLGAVLIVFYLLFRLMNPSDWVEVTARSIPGDARAVFLIADSSGKATGLPGYDTKALPFTHRYPRVFTRDVGPVPLQWRDADRYGVLAEMRDGSWKLCWLGPGDLSKPWVWRHLVGGGSAEFRVPDPSRAEVPSTEFVDRLDLPPP